MGRGLMELEIRDANAKEILPENEIRFFSLVTSGYLNKIRRDSMGLIFFFFQNYV